LASFLIMPIQRLLRYRLLLDDLIKHTEGGDRDLAALGESLRTVVAIAETMNEKKRETDNLQVVREIAGRFSTEQTLKVVGPKLSVEVCFFLLRAPALVSCFF
jgi:hypothetical protein